MINQLLDEYYYEDMITEIYKAFPRHITIWNFLKVAVIFI